MSEHDISRAHGVLLYAFVFSCVLSPAKTGGAAGKGALGREKKLGGGKSESGASCQSTCLPSPSALLFYFGPQTACIWFLLPSCGLLIPLHLLWASPLSLSFACSNQEKMVAEQAEILQRRTEELKQKEQLLKEQQRRLAQLEIQQKKSTA